MNMKEYEEKNLNVNIKVRERPLIFKFSILQTMFVAKTVYGINDIKINEECLQELNKLIIEDFNAIFNKTESEYKNDLIFITAEKEFNFILKCDNITNHFFNDYITLHNEIGYDLH